MLKINPANLIQPNTIPAGGGAAVSGQGAAFAARLEQAVQTSGLAGAAPAKGSEDAKLKAACQELEAVFLNMMLARMRASVPKTKLMGDTSGEEIMQSLLDTELTKNMAQAGGMGLAAMLYRQLSKSPVKGQAR
ncbi:rod-binding protein [Sporomusa termitida]|uniref:Flagellar rod assembly protein/muramidase FlgJ n=1 Tax=Sporomusa termitida TaxID=2377 RepID=A0A517DXN4_9FIRM|nr:rod-binding protein [Sporomusa termitida]QDR82093.1 flagellar rod assembly protein/muramidase FlgJ [Sporomusa termitida]